jgi:hypothetical protein
MNTSVGSTNKNYYMCETPEAIILTRIIPTWKCVM